MPISERETPPSTTRASWQAPALKRCQRSPKVYKTPEPGRTATTTLDQSAPSPDAVIPSKGCATKKTGLTGRRTGRGLPSLVSLAPYTYLLLLSISPFPASHLRLAPTAPSPSGKQTLAPSISPDQLHSLHTPPIERHSKSTGAETVDAIRQLLLISNVFFQESVSSRRLKSKRDWSGGLDWTTTQESSNRDHHLERNHRRRPRPNSHRDRPSLLSHTLPAPQLQPFRFTGFSILAGYFTFVHTKTLRSTSHLSPHRQIPIIKRTPWVPLASRGPGKSTCSGLSSAACLPLAGTQVSVTSSQFPRELRLPDCRTQPAQQLHCFPEPPPPSWSEADQPGARPFPSSIHIRCPDAPHRAALNPTQLNPSRRAHHSSWPSLTLTTSYFAHHTLPTITPCLCIHFSEAIQGTTRQRMHRNTGG
ncbi:RNA recognition domain-containing protein [Colletotrichum scovillei]|uniref:RNA recognition domain-containing protein n=1 Tax=Colletotrichum scovillei TaxID=1209932 RepID=A0A9P7RHW1_9PEZI|nr:RNA recognition domain-containing protein [Colletotrichum scovillei]KAG7076967.1 RNA recognition domain-containing protein [Colletotrichum scovillei]